MSLVEEIKQAVIDEFREKLTDVNNQIAAVTNAIDSKQKEIEQIQGTLSDLREIQRTNNQHLNGLQRRQRVLQQSVDKLSNGDIIIRNR